MARAGDGRVGQWGGSRTTTWFQLAHHDQQVRAAIDSETAELQRRELVAGGRPVVDPRARIVILVDDGIANRREHAGG